MRFEHELYVLRYEPSKNRVYQEMRGFWQSVDEVPELLNQWDQLLTKARPGFTFLADARELVAPTEPVLELFKVIQRKIQTAGMSRRAEVFSKSAIGRMATQSVSEITGFHSVSKYFQTFDEAEIWLDEIMLSIPADPPTV